MGKILALDLGGTAVKYGIVDPNGDILFKDKVKTPPTLADLLAWLSALLQDKSVKDIEGVAVSSPGAPGEDGVIYGGSAIPYLHGPNVKQLMESVTGLPVAMENDANCAGLAEVWQGAAKGLKDVAVVVIGTGIGGALIQAGRIHKGAHLHGGEFGYMILDPADLASGENTFSRLASTSSIIRRAARYKAVDAKTLTGEAVFQMAADGDGSCVRAIDEFYRMLALGVYNIQYAYDPERILIGGGISRRSDMIERLAREVAEVVSNVDVAQVVPEVGQCHFLGDANLIGAVYHYLQQADDMTA